MARVTDALSALASQLSRGIQIDSVPITHWYPQLRELWLEPGANLPGMLFQKVASSDPGTLGHSAAVKSIEANLMIGPIGGGDDRLFRNMDTEVIMDYLTDHQYDGSIFSVLAADRTLDGNVAALQFSDVTSDLMKAEGQLPHRVLSFGVQLWL